MVDADRVRRKVFMHNGRGGQHLHDGVDKTRVSEVWQAHVTVHLTISQHGTLTTRATKKLSYRQGTARCFVSVEILSIATQQCRMYLYDAHLGHTHSSIYERWCKKQNMGWFGVFRGHNSK